VFFQEYVDSLREVAVRYPRTFADAAMLALTFQVGNDKVAVDVRRVREVVPRVRLSPVNDGPHWLAGVFVYRGHVVPVIDLHKLIGAGECPPHLSSRIILLPWPADSESLVGLLATQVAEIRDLPTGELEQMETVSSQSRLGTPLPDGHSIIRILNPDRLLAQVAPGAGGLIA
jgi:chemotaxis-related protein WspB